MITNIKKRNVILTIFTAVVICAIAMVAVSADAQTVVSVNLDRQDADPNQNTDQIPAASVIGVIPAANWNNSDINPVSNPYTGLVDSTNSPVAGLQFTLTGGGSDSWNTGGHIPARMMGDWMNGITGFDITNIPANSGVTLITYHGGFNAGDDLPPDNTINVTASTVAMQYQDTNWDNNEFDNAGTWAYTQNENYLRWDFVGDTSSIAATFQTVNGTRALNAFQLELSPAIPEPSAMVLAIISALGLTLCGWRRRRLR